MCTTSLTKNTLETKMVQEDVKDYAPEKLKEVLVLMQYWWEEAIHTVFSPETIHKFNYWVQVGSRFLVAWLVLLLLMFCCKCCGRGGGGRSQRTIELLVEIIQCQEMSLIETLDLIFGIFVLETVNEFLLGCESFVSYVALIINKCCYVSCLSG